jgi:mutator protein MutT
MKYYKEFLKENISANAKIKKKITVAAGVIVREDEESGRKQVLLIQRASEDHWPNHWEFPRGKCDKGDSDKPEACAKREIKEETGLDVRIIEIIDTFEYIADRGERQSTCYNYLCEQTKKSQKVVLSKEHKDYKWISEVGEAELLMLPDQKKTLEKILNSDREISSTPENDFTKNNTLEEYLQCLNTTI